MGNHIWMMRVENYIDKSSFHGIGLFSKRCIKRGTIVWEYHPDIDISFKPDKWIQLIESLDPHSATAIRKYAYKENDHYVVCIDNAQFMNHSENDFNVSNGDDSSIMIATKLIQPGDELLCNYFTCFDSDDENIKTIKIPKQLIV